MKNEYEKLSLKEKAVFENAKDCIIYGYGFKNLNTCGLSKEEAKKIWIMAFNYLVEN